MPRKWTERLAEASTNEQGDALFPFLQETFATYLAGASQISGLIWNAQELHSLLGGWDNERIPADMSYGSFLHTFMKSETDEHWEDIAYSLLFYGLIEPMSLIDQADRTARACQPHEESEV